MSAALQPPMSLDAFLDWERRQDTKHEFDGTRPVAMAGGSVEHAAIQANLMFAIGARLLGGPCRMYGSDLKISAAGSIRYPDAFVVCSPVPRGASVVDDPVVVFEVLSRSTSFTDRIEKNLEYRRTPSIRRYVILEQTSQAATVYARDGADWKAETPMGEADLALPEIGLTVPLSELYRDVAFPTGHDGAGDGV